MQPAEFRPAQNYDTNPYYDNAEWPGPGYVTVEPLTVTENDTYTAPEGKAYSPVTVNVSSGTLDVGALQAYTTIIYSSNEQQYFSSSNYMDVRQIKINDVPVMKYNDDDFYSYAQIESIASGVTVDYGPFGIDTSNQELVLHFFEGTYDSETRLFTIAQELDVDYELIEIGESGGYTYYTAEFVVPEVAENTYFGIYQEFIDLPTI